MKSILKSKIFWAVIIVILGIRFVAPLVVLRGLNRYLADFSPIYSGHVDDLNLSLFRGAYRIQGVELRLKAPGKQPDRFVYGRAIDVSLDWRELFKGRITTDIEVDRTEIVLTPLRVEHLN